MTTDQARRALLLTTSFPSDAADYAGAFVAQSARDLVTRGWRVRVLAPTGGWAPAGVERLAYSMPASLRRAHGIPDTLEAAPIRGHLEGLATTLHLWRAARRLHHPDELIVAHWLVPCGLVAGHLGRGRVRITRRAHGVAHGGDVALLERLPGGRRLADRLDRKLAGITFVSDDLRRRFDALLSRPPQGRRSVIPMGIALTAGRADCAEHLRRLAGGRRIIATVGRLTPIKGLEFLAQAMRGLDDVIWFCAGDGPEADRLDTLSRGLGIRRVALGAVEPAQRDALLSIADVFVLPSHPRGNRTEGTPTALLEALAAGTPCIASDTGGVGVVAREAGAIVVDPGHVTGLRAALDKILSEPNAREAMAEAHRRVGRRYRWGTIGARHAAALALSGGL